MRTLSVKVVGGMEKRRGDDAEDERRVGFMLVSTSWGQCPEALRGRATQSGVAVKNSVVVKSAGPRADSSGSYSGNTA